MRKPRNGESMAEEKMGRPNPFRRELRKILIKPEKRAIEKSKVKGTKVENRMLKGRIKV